MGAISKEILSISDLYSILPLGRSTIHKLVARQDFPKVKVGRRVLIYRAKLFEWMEQNVGQTINLTEND
ncbi:helix-turn-helix domain-containing protein [Paenibacillus sp. HW567]|uniref:helix-turn-helix transcriptional regulator n=1 Tax=Paenibacillus sp. HW567 TaxID=1034769 RepID=UPI00035F7446